MFNYDEIEKARKEFGLPAKYSDEEVQKTNEMTSFLAQEYIKKMTDGLDDDIKHRVRKKLLKQGYTDDEIDDYENIRTKMKYKLKVKLPDDQLEKIAQFSEDYTDVYTEIQKRVMKKRWKNAC